MQASDGWDSAELDRAARLAGEVRARAGAERLAEGLRNRAGRIHAALRIDPPEPCVVPRLRELFRWQVLVRGPRDTSVQRLLHEAAAERQLAPAVQRFTVDVDPLDLF